MVLQLLSKPLEKAIRRFHIKQGRADRHICGEREGEGWVGRRAPLIGMSNLQKIGSGSCCFLVSATLLYFNHYSGWLAVDCQTIAALGLRLTIISVSRQSLTPTSP